MPASLEMEFWQSSETLFGAMTHLLGPSVKHKGFMFYRFPALYDSLWLLIFETPGAVQTGMLKGRKRVYRTAFNASTHTFICD